MGLSEILKDVFDQADWERRLKRVRKHPLVRKLLDATLKNLDWLDGAAQEIGLGRIVRNIRQWVLEIDQLDGLRGPEKKERLLQLLRDLIGEARYTELLAQHGWLVNRAIEEAVGTTPRKLAELSAMLGQSP